MARIHLSEHFSYGKLTRFVFPSIMMMIFTSIYSVVDGLFVSNFVGKTAFAAVNLTAPVSMVLAAAGFMIGTGGSALIGKTLGEGKRDAANRYFSMLIASVVLGGVVLTAVGFAVLRPAVLLLGAEGQLLKDSILYGRIILAAQTFFMLQTTFQSFFVTAEKPTLGLAVTVLSGLTNMALDALFVAVFHWGLAGAAFATAVSQVAGALIPIFYFAVPNDSLLRLTRKTKLYPKVLWNACANGSSEMVSNLASSLVALLYNYQLMRLLGENGVAAYGVIMYAGFIFAAINMGYTIGISPVISFHYGANNRGELKNLFQKSLLLVSGGGIVMFLAAETAARPMARLFVGYDMELLELTVHAAHIFAFAFLLNGVNTFASAFFTALNDGVVSAVLSFLRTFLFEMICILCLPLIWDADGLWSAMTAAEAASLLVTVYFLLRKRTVYHYA